MRNKTAVQTRQPIDRSTLPRNNVLLDKWSLVHFATGIGLGWLLNPTVAIIIMILWEPLEIFWLSPILSKRGILFGYETWRNSFSDIIVDTAGVLLGAFLLTDVAAAPFRLF